MSQVTHIADTGSATDQQQERVQIIVFRLGNEEYGLLIDEIKEVVITPPIAKIPLAPPYIKGVANIRGNILAIVDLEEKFMLKPAEAEADERKSHYSLVVESPTHKMAILVKEVPNTLSVGRALIDQSPGLIAQTGEHKGYIKGIIKLEKRLIILIDLLKIISTRDINNALQEP